MTAVSLLYVLAALDAALSGYRAAGGRNALVRKRAYQAKSQLRGVIWGQAAIVAAATFSGLLIAASPDAPRLVADLLEGSRRALAVYLPYSLVFIGALALRIFPSVDLRSTLNTLVFGPFTFLRPFVGVAGVAWAYANVPRWEVPAVGLTALALMLGVEWGLNRWYAWKDRESRGPLTPPGGASTIQAVVPDDGGAQMADPTSRLPAGANDPHDLRRFVEAQAGDYARALAEVKAGRKRTHWMWYVFPQFDGLGFSSTAQFYAIKSVAEAEAYLAHPVLGPRLVECAGAALAVEGKSAHDIFGSPDDLKLRSCATLFAYVSPPGSVFHRLLDKFYDGNRDEKTLRLIGAGESR